MVGIDNAGCGFHDDGYDYTCDDCVLGADHYDPEEQNDLPPSNIKFNDPPF